MHGINTCFCFVPLPLRGAEKSMMLSGSHAKMSFKMQGDRLPLTKGGYKACQFSLENKNNFSRDFERSYKSNHLAFRVTFIEKLFLCHLPVRKRTFKASGQQEFIYSDAYVLFSGG